MMFGAGWKRIFAEHRRAILVIGGLAAANLVGYLLVVYPLESRYAQTLQRVERARLALAGSLADERQATAAVAAKEQADRDLSEFYSKVLPASEADARQLTYRRLAVMARSHGLEFDRRTFSLEPEPESRLDRLTLAMTVSGSYRNIRGFLHEIETTPAFLVIRGLTVEQPEFESGPVEMSVELATYIDRSPPTP